MLLHRKSKNTWRQKLRCCNTKNLRCCNTTNSVAATPRTTTKKNCVAATPFPENDFFCFSELETEYFSVSKTEYYFDQFLILRQSRVLFYALFLCFWIIRNPENRVLLSVHILLLFQNLSENSQQWKQRIFPLYFVWNNQKFPTWYQSLSRLFEDIKEAERRFVAAANYPAERKRCQGIFQISFLCSCWRQLSDFFYSQVLQEWRALE